MTKELEVTTQEPLEERRMVWALESYIPGRLCAWKCVNTGKEYIEVFRSECDALDMVSNGKWLTPNTGVKPMELSLESVIQQTKEQGPDPQFNLFCAGYVWMPEMEFVEVPR